MSSKDMTWTHYERAYSEPAFRHALGQRARAAGRAVVEQALALYYALRSPDTPVWAKSVILGALGYFISLLDAVPDVTPLVGYTDDFAVMAAAAAMVARCVTPAMRERARRRAADLLGDA